ncbi:hypothetical protein BLNAU_18892 [Blattamonas nauphoetae]|uniref:Uncharacterized protein n=1 Tax=Blattamonas nauphoetae TaxID=2049346 RepID=A0ABQ9X306_9EUKA|nr:hypothetical protein BLNAU_18892 [Blattamonas nauphoetae]
MTIKATYHQNFVFHNANLCQIAHHQPNLLDHLPLRMHTQYQPVRSTLLLNLHPLQPKHSTPLQVLPSGMQNVKDGEPVTLQLIGHYAFAVLPGGTGTRISRPPAHEGGCVRLISVRACSPLGTALISLPTRSGRWSVRCEDTRPVHTDRPHLNHPVSQAHPNSSSAPGSPYTPSSPTTKHTRWSASSQQWPTPCFSRFVSTVEKVFQIEVTELSNAVESDQSKRSSTSRSSSTSALSTLLSPPHNLMSSRQKKAKTRNHPLSSPSSPTTTRSFQTFCTNPSAASSRFIAMLLCNIVSLAAQRSSACDKTKQSQSNLSFLPATLPRKERHSIAESMLALRLNMFSKEKWKPHKFLQLIQRILFDLLDSEMHKLGFSFIPLSPLRQSIRLNMSVVAAVNTGLRSISEISESREDPRTIARQDTQLDRKDTDQESQNCPVSGRLCASELDSASPFCEVAHNFAGQMTKLLKRFEAINNLPAESQFQRARYLSIMISECVRCQSLLQVMCYKRLRKHREKTSLRDTAATVQL